MDNTIKFLLESLKNDELIKIEINKAKHFYDLRFFFINVFGVEMSLKVKSDILENNEIVKKLKEKIHIADNNEMNFNDFKNFILSISDKEIKTVGVMRNV